MARHPSGDRPCVAPLSCWRSGVTVLMDWNSFWISLEHGYIFVPNPVSGGYISFDTWMVLLVGFVVVGVTALVVNRASSAELQ